MIINPLNEVRLKFLSTWSRESAWVHGLLYGDGCFFSDGRTHRVLFFGNSDTVDKLNALLKVDIKNPRFNEHEELSGYESYFDAKVVVDWFYSRGLASKKTPVISMPKDLPDEFKWDFLRGLIDTDGSFSFQKGKDKGRLRLRVGFASANKSFCEEVRDALGVVTKVVESRKTIEGQVFRCYSFLISGFEESLQVLRKIYDCPSYLRNEERYQKYLKGEQLFAQYNAGCKHCGKPIHTRDVCTEHMHEEKKRDSLCEGCGAVVYSKSRSFCSACKCRHERLMKNPELKTRKRRK